MYHYETLGDERFQELCQALITATFPDAQCLPVGQPDGGRDAFVLQHYVAHRPSRRQRANQPAPDIIVFQVKYVRSPRDTREERDMLLQVARSEKNNIERLKSLGLTRYYLITNLRGTAHPEAGSIDKVNNELSTLIGVKSHCWWRDDVDRRLDAHSDIKWAYPEVLKATDILGALITGQLGESEERRRTAIRAYLTNQYDDDEELKFKQTDLRSTMTDLFVDLPMQPVVQSGESDPNGPSLYMGSAYAPQPHLWRADNYIFHAGLGMQAADFFLSSGPSRYTSRVVLEGAPGQGKSTVTQYVCQILRMKLLGRQEALATASPHHKHIKIRIPFRIDLRDLAKWFSGVDPFQPKPMALDDHEPRSLEGFLAAQIRSLSGGHTFDVSDLAAVARASRVFLALDGFDEVADVDLRQRIVDEITKGVNRLVNAGGLSVEALVTSRPAAFAKSVRFPREHWRYFELLPLDRPQVDEYTSRWMKAKGLKEAEKSQLRTTLDSKLKEAHTQYLAKNPMQLTILLSLINNRGASLPERRTAMYDAYMDMFFSRESEKSHVVRDNRDLLIDIHRHLAWELHTSAESGGSGTIEYSELRVALFRYLSSQGEDTTIVGALFDGIIERVGALVSRVQDLYEFEVQPLREYFAARHLYETAPYPSSFEEGSRGDKFDRFNSLIRNPYWLNVARFYGGCFNKGELFTLVNEIEEFGSASLYQMTSHPRSIALMLLSDWVFTQYQPAVQRIVNFVSERPRLRQLLADAEESGVSHWSGLPDRNGRRQFLDLLWQYLKETEKSDELRAICRAIFLNTSPAERTGRWIDISDQIDSDKWLDIGIYLLVHKDESRHFVEFMAHRGDESIFRLLMTGQQFRQLESLSGSISASLAHVVSFRHHNILRDLSDQCASRTVATLFSYYQYGIALNEQAGPSVAFILQNHFGTVSGTASKDPMPHLVTEGLQEAEQAAVNAYETFISTRTAITATSLNPWIEYVAALRLAWGDSPSVDRIAFLAAGVRSKLASGVEARLSETDDLVSAARFARLKSGAPQWWARRLSTESDAGERRRWLLLLWLWGTPRTLIRLSPILHDVLATQAEAEWIQMSLDFRAIYPLLPNREDKFEPITADLQDLWAANPRLGVFVGQRLAGASRRAIAIHVVTSTNQLSRPDRDFCLSAILSSSESDEAWEAALPLVRELYRDGARYIQTRRALSVPSDAAAAICSHPEDFPLPLVAIADTSLRSVAGAQAPRLLEVAQDQRWFLH